MGRFSRFRHIERTRSDDASPVSNGAKHDRFSRVRGPAEEGAPEAPTPGPARTFERRHHATATSAEPSGSSSSSPRERSPSTPAASENRAGPATPTNAPPTRPLAMADEQTRRAVGEYLAESISRRASRQFGSDGWGWARRPWGLKLLDRIQPRRARWSLLAALIGVPLAMVVLGDRGAGVHDAGVVLLVFVIASFTPRRRRWRLFRW